jgi:hypothetical protein
MPAAEWAEGAAFEKSSSFRREEIQVRSEEDDLFCA